jgi:hypothetical protein
MKKQDVFLLQIFFVVGSFIYVTAIANSCGCRLNNQSVDFCNSNVSAYSESIPIPITVIAQSLLASSRYRVMTQN